MRIKRIIFIAVAAFLLLYILNSVNDSAVNINKLPAPISVESIIADFQDLSDNDELPGEALDYQDAKKLYVPMNYTGQSGEVFYLVIASHVYKYKIETITENNKDVLVYRLDDIFVNIALPESKFEIYEIR